MACAWGFFFSLNITHKSITNWFELKYFNHTFNCLTFDYRFGMRWERLCVAFNLNWNIRNGYFYSLFDSDCVFIAHRMLSTNWIPLMPFHRARDGIEFLHKALVAYHHIAIKSLKLNEKKRMQNLVKKRSLSKFVVLNRPCVERSIFYCYLVHAANHLFQSLSLLCAISNSQCIDNPACVYINISQDIIWLFLSEL